MPIGALERLARQTFGRKAAVEDLSKAIRARKAAQAFGTYEQTPGAGIGHLEELINAPYSERLKYTQDPRASWASDGEDRLYKALGYKTQPSRSMVGAFTPEGGKLEINPGMVGRFELPATDEAISPALRDMGTVESARAYLDAQNAGAGHVVHPLRSTPLGERTSLVFDLGKSPSRSQMADLADLAGRYNFYPIDTGRGVSFMNDIFSEVGGARTGADTEALMHTISPEVGRLLPGYKMTPAKMSGAYEGYNEAYHTPGSGDATRKFLADMAANPEAAARIEPELMQRAAAKHAQDMEYSSATGYALRDDIQRARRILSEGGITGLQKALEAGVVLPAVAAAILMPRREEN